nr:reverse transcriptase domain-containing protein [Tanacetum cinerariifolium]
MVRENRIRVSYQKLSSGFPSEVCYLHLVGWCSDMVELPCADYWINEAYEMSWKDLMKLMIEVYCPRNEIQKLENELWNLSVKGTDIIGYTRRF